MKADSVSGSNYIISISELCTYGNYVSTGSTTAFLQDVISEVSSSFETYCDKGLAVQSYTGVYDGDATCELPLNNYPIQSVLSINYRTSENSSWTNLLTGGSISGNVLLQDWKLRLVNYSFPYGKNNIQVVYTAGYATGSKELNTIKSLARKACVNEINKSYAQTVGKGLLGITSKNSGGNINSGTNYYDIIPEIEKNLDKFRKLY